MRSRLTMIGVGTALLLGLWLVLLYLPTRARQTKVQSQVLAAKTQLDDYKATLAQLPTMIQARAAIQAKLRSSNSSLYAKKDLVKLFDDLKGKAGLHGLKVVEITPPVTELLSLNQLLPEAGEPQFLNLTVVLRGDYINFGHFVQQLEQTIYFRDVRSCVISGRENNDGQATYSLGFKALLGMTMGGAS
ncbi:MAG: hypothetical protein NDJ18_03155 [candidate division Zixibacteria bacterium]|nr:hypothetical protein [candidate division Zixibacteria bacterium]